jgi:WD40 repeat protein
VPTGLEGGVYSLAFLDDSALYTAGHGGIRRWNLDTGAMEVVKDYGAAILCLMVMSGDRRVAFTQTEPLWVGGCSPVERLDLATGVSTPLPQLGDCHRAPPPALVAGVLAAGGEDGLVRVGRESDREAHLLVGHVGVSSCTAVSPDRKWVASTGEDNTLRLWPMPDLSKPPLHTLPQDELIAKLKSFTNLRAVRDPKSATGWSIELGPFPGWKDLPTWEP